MTCCPARDPDRSIHAREWSRSQTVGRTTASNFSKKLSARFYIDIYADSPGVVSAIEGYRATGIADINLQTSLLTMRQTTLAMIRTAVRRSGEEVCGRRDPNPAARDPYPTIIDPLKMRRRKLSHHPRATLPSPLTWRTQRTVMRGQPAMVGPFLNIK